MDLICVICESKFVRYGKQVLEAKTCSRKCMGEYFKAKPNTTCTTCGKFFHMKQSQKDRYERPLGYFCSVNCLSENKKETFKGSGNHQNGLIGHLNPSYKGLIINKTNHKQNDLYIYVGKDYPKSNKSGRVLYHRYLVNENNHLFDDKFFEVINGKAVIKDDFDVHHKDGNHDNNSISNLDILTHSEHTSLHNREKIIIRDKTGRISGVFKSGELLENLEADNQQPS